MRRRVARRTIVTADIILPVKTGLLTCCNFSGNFQVTESNTVAGSVHYSQRVSFGSQTGAVLSGGVSLHLSNVSCFPSPPCTASAGLPSSQAEGDPAVIQRGFCTKIVFHWRNSHSLICPKSFDLTLQLPDSVIP